MPFRKVMTAGLSWKCQRAQVAQMTSFEAKSAGDLAEANMKKKGITWVTFEGSASSIGRKTLATTTS
jgi:hypothetical protein